MRLWTNPFLLPCQRQGAGGEQTTGAEEKNHQRILMVVSLIPALCTPTDSVSGQVLLIYTDLSENILHAFIQHSCHWSGVTPLVLLPCAALRDAQGGTSSSSGSQDGQAAGGASPCWDTPGKAAKLDLYSCTPPETGLFFLKSNALPWKQLFLWGVLSYHNH